MGIEIFALLPNQIMGWCPRRWQAKAASAQAGGQFSERRALERSDSHEPLGAWPTLRRSTPRPARARRESTAANAPIASHGGARPCGSTVLLAVGNCLGPASVCTTRSRPAPQHGHCCASMPPVPGSRMSGKGTLSVLSSQLCPHRFTSMAGGCAGALEPIRGCHRV